VTVEVVGIGTHRQPAASSKRVIHTRVKPAGHSALDVVGAGVLVGGQVHTPSLLQKSEKHAEVVDVTIDEVFEGGGVGGGIDDPFVDVEPLGKTVSNLRNGSSNKGGWLVNVMAVRSHGFGGAVGGGVVSARAAGWK
jgi:hypothetical protein